MHRAEARVRHMWIESGCRAVESNGGVSSCCQAFACLSRLLCYVAGSFTLVREHYTSWGALHHLGSGVIPG